MIFRIYSTFLKFFPRPYVQISFKGPSNFFQNKYANLFILSTRNCSSSIPTDQDEGEVLNTENEDIDSILELPPYMTEAGLHKLYKENILVIQPKVKWGPKKLKNTTPELQIAEAVTLANTLPGWNVIDQIIVPMQKEPRKIEYFGSGKLKELIGHVQSMPNITGIFIAINRLSGLQHRFLTETFKCRIYDRYSVVLHIFRDHASTGEARLQIALAEIPYLKALLHEILDTQISRPGYGRENISRSGKTIYEEKKELLKRREHNIRKALERLKKQRMMIRENRKHANIPIVAVIGYTNSGKTTLIRSLTGDNSLIPKNHLFATLDVTAHAGQLFSSSQMVLYIDTVGFISNIPTDLIASFASTLEDIFLADVIIHIKDLSHPDLVAQHDNVMETLRSLNPSPKLLDTMIEVGNKIDLLPTPGEEQIEENVPQLIKGSKKINSLDLSNTFQVSATKGWGLDSLNKEIEKQIFANTNLTIKKFRVPNGLEEMRWLVKYCGIHSMIPCPEDPNFMLITSVLSPTNLGKFLHYYGHEYLCEDVQ